MFPVNEGDRDRCISSYLNREDAELYIRRSAIVHKDPGVLDVLNAPFGVERQTSYGNLDVS